MEHEETKFEGIIKEVKDTIDKVRVASYNEGYVQANKDKEFDPLMHPNINFSLVSTLSEIGERKELYKKQRIERGFDDTELWNLDSTILKFVLPRLKAFKECTCGYPGNVKSEEEWQNILQKMIDSIEKIIIDEAKDEDYEGFELFKKYFFNLWW